MLLMADMHPALFVVFAKGGSRQNHIPVLAYFDWPISAIHTRDHDREFPIKLGFPPQL